MSTTQTAPNAADTTLTETEILAMQDIAVQTQDMELLYDTYAALGYDRRVGFMLVGDADRQAAVRRLLVR